jgi:myosin-5
VLQTNPILEAFGNAKTGLNDNSSRFGRLIEIFFGGGGRRGICGARVHAYLLEKSRVVRQQPGERSFHVFYQLCRGASDAERAHYGLPPADAALAGFAYLAGSGCTSVEGVDDAAEFRRVKAALHAVGIGEERQQELFSQLAAVLHLGNVRFSPLHDDAAEVEAGSAAPLQQAAALLGVPAAALAAALTTRRMEAGGERITRQLSAEAAGDNRDALAKALYAAAFSWLVAQVRRAASPPSIPARSAAGHADLPQLEHCSAPGHGTLKKGSMAQPEPCPEAAGRLMPVPPFLMIRLLAEAPTFAPPSPPDQWRAGGGQAAFGR